MNQRFEQKLTGLTVSALPSDVRRGFASSGRRSYEMWLRHSFGLRPSGTARTGGKAALLNHSHGKAEPCRTSGGGAAVAFFAPLYEQAQQYLNVWRNQRRYGLLQTSS